MFTNRLSIKVDLKGLSVQSVAVRTGNYGIVIPTVLNSLPTLTPSHP